jgi:hypothetical protein
LNCFRIGDRGAAEFLDNHKQRILYGSLIAVVAFLCDESIVAARPGDDLVMPPIEFMRFRALAIEGCDDFLVFVR